MQAHLACRYIKICVLTRYTLCDSLVMICATKRKFHSFFCDVRQCFHPVTKKVNIEIPALLKSTTIIYFSLSHLAYRYIKMWVLIRHTLSRSLKNSDIGQRCRPAKNSVGNRKSGHVRIVSKIRYF